MTIDKTIAALLLAPLVGLGIPAALLFWKVPAGGMTAVERELINFASQPVVVSQPGPQTYYSGLECPVRPPAAKDAPKQPQGTGTAAAGFPPGPIPSPKAAAAAPPKERPGAAGRLPSVSMIYQDGNTRMAIIDGHVLHEGASLDGKRIIRIEKTRVLLRAAGKDIWLNID